LVYATHAPERVLGWADQVVCLEAGRVLAAGPVEELYRRPASRNIAACLGPANWFGADETRRYFNQEGPLGCVRPEGLEVVPDPAGPATVASSRFHGAHAATVLAQDNSSITVLHRPITAMATGLRVSLRLLALVLAVMLAGCGGQPQVLVPRQVTVVPVPPDGPVQPAPRGVACGRDGEWLVLDTVGRVLVYGPDRTLRRQWRMPAWDVGRPENATVLADGRVAVADTHYHRVVIFDRVGAVLTMFGSEGDGPGQFRWPVGICSDAGNRLYVSEYGGNDRVQVFDDQGRLLRSFGSFGGGAGQLQRPQNLCWHDGVIFIADAMNNRIQRFRDDGTPLGVLGGDQAPVLQFPYALAVAATGAMTVVEYSGNRLTRLDGAGRVLDRFGKAGRGTHEFSTPWGMAMDGTGRVWVADTGNRRMVEVVP
jgi:DNA-binding beta-propeller fold protein YncE